MIVNIYLYQTIKGPGTKAGYYTYILETYIKGKAATLTVTDKLEPMSENKAELTILLKALKRLRKQCDVVIYGLNNYTVSGINEWAETWLAAGWKNKKGKDIANKEEWQEVMEYLVKYNIATSSEENSYSRWMVEQTEKEREKDGI